MKRRLRDFDKREDSEKAWILKNTWCENCHKADLGQNNPQEFEESGQIFIEGNCKVCGNLILTEIITTSSPHQP